MDNDHAITGELRKWAKTLTHWWYDPVKNEYTYTSGTMPPSIDAIRLDSNILAIADRIDAEHEQAMAAAALIAGVPMTDEHMAEHGWVKLPVDADGKPWHIGDMTEHMQTVQGMCLNRHGWYFFGTVNDIDPSIHRHHHEPTVEDVLHELVDEWVMANSTEDEEAAIAECAKKLQLRGDEQ